MVEKVRLRRVVIRVLSVVLVAGFACWALRGIDRRAFFEAVVRANPMLLLLAASVNLVAVGVQAWRWKLLLRPLGKLSYSTSLGAMIVTFAMSAILPARAGELARVHVASRRLRVGPAAIAGSAVLDHIVNGIAIAPLALVLPFATGLPPWLHTGILAFLTLAFAGAMAAWTLAGSNQQPVPGSMIGRIIGDLRGGLAGARSPGLVLQALTVGVLAWILEAATAWIALRALGLSFPPAIAIVVLIAVNISLAIPSPAGNLGTFELGAVLILTALGTPRETAIAFALCFHLLHIISIWVAGLPALLWLRRQTDRSPIPSVGV